MEQLDYRQILTGRAEWEGDVLHVHDMIRDVVNGVEQQIESSVMNHFDMDFTDLREYLSDKEAWSRKQAEAIPKWIPVTERLPEYPGRFMCVYEVGEYGEVGHCIDWGRYDPDDGWYVSGVTHWMPIPDSPEMDEEKDNERI